jgi:4-aminobutyrate aminotransferase-like enzyme
MMERERNLRTKEIVSPFCVFRYNNCVKIRPPLIVSRIQIDFALSVFERALTKLQKWKAEKTKAKL